jgi:hypothetical protein
MTKTKKKQTKAPVSQPAQRKSKTPAQKAAAKRRRDRRKNRALANAPGGIAYLEYAGDVRHDVAQGMRRPLRLDAPSTFDAWIASVMHPFGAPVRCPMTWNTAPTEQTHVFKSTRVNQYTVASGGGAIILVTCKTSINNGASTAQANSLIGCFVGNPGVNYTFGPAAIGAEQPCMGVIIPTAQPDPSQAGSFSAFANVANAQALVPAVLAPYAGVTSQAANYRFRPVSAGIRVANTTNVSNRGGEVFTVTPNSGGFGGLTTIQQLGMFANFTDQSSRLLTEGIEVHVAPRPVDLAYWYDNNGSNTGTFDEAMIIVCICNATAFSQTYVLDTVINWEVAGYLTQGLNTKTSHNPVAKDLYEPAHASAVTSGTPSPGSSIHEHIHAAAKNAVATLNDHAEALKPRGWFAKLAHAAQEMSEDMGRLA